jgi:hypothetical protein
MLQFIAVRGLLIYVTEIFVLRYLFSVLLMQLLEMAVWL